jgi:hypothetical protein
MGKRFIIAVGLVLCANLALASSVRVKASRANVRSEPSVSAKVIGTVAQGKTLDVIVTVGDWIKVTDGSSTGWVHKSLVESVPDAPATRPPSAASERTSSAASTTSGSSSSRSASSQRRASSDEKKIAFGLGASFETGGTGFGLHGRVMAAPLKTLPALRGIVEFDYFLKSDTGWHGTLNAAYMIGESQADYRPYLGAGLVYSHASGGGSSTNLDLAAGVIARQHLFLEGRVVLADDTAFILSAGWKF